MQSNNNLEIKDLFFLGAKEDDILWYFQSMTNIGVMYNTDFQDSPGFKVAEEVDKLRKQIIDSCEKMKVTYIFPELLIIKRKVKGEWN